MSRKVVAAVSDLFFIAKMQSAARHAGVDLQFAVSSGDLMEMTRAGAELVIFDLNHTEWDVLGGLREIRSEPETASVCTLAFFSHVDVELARRARAAGCDRVLPRSQFSSELVKLLLG